MARQSRSVRTSVLTLLVALLALLLVPVAASAETETFHRFEVEGTANYTITEDCGDGTTAQTRVTVIGGHEEESTNGETTLDEDFVTVLIRAFDCDFNFRSERISGPANFTFSPGLNHASVTADFTDEDGRAVSVDMTWEGVGGVETTSNVTTFPGFHGHFVGRERDAVATGTVVIDGETVVDGSTTNANIQSLEDTNRTSAE
jgi:hypothetical protein